MIRSMTGFGRGEYSDGISKVTVEIRSVDSLAATYCHTVVALGPSTTVVP